MKVLFVVLVLMAAWLSWMWRYEVQVIPVTVAELYSANDQNWAIDQSGVAFSVNAETGLASPMTNATGEPFKALIPKTPAIVWRWDRWTATGKVERFAQVDAAGRVTLTPILD